MARYDGLIIPRSWNEYINKSDAATLAQALQQNNVLDNAPTENSTKGVRSGGVYSALATKQPTLTFDDVPTDGSNNPVKSNGIYDVLATKQDTLTFDNAPTEDSDNPVKSGGVYTALGGKQDTLTFDDEPTANSNNPVKSGGVKSAISNAIDYSETETDTGAKWINGKAIYRKVLYKNQSLNSGNTTIDVSGDNLTVIETLINATMIRIKVGSTTPAVLTYPVRYSQSDNTLVVYGSNTTWDGPIYIVLEYTKTS